MEQSSGTQPLQFSYLKLFWFGGAWKRVEKRFGFFFHWFDGSKFRKDSVWYTSICTWNGINDIWIKIAVHRINNQPWQICVFPSEIRNGILILGYPLSISKVGFFLLHFKRLEIQSDLSKYSAASTSSRKKETFAKGDSSCLKISIHVFILLLPGISLCIGWITLKSLLPSPLTAEGPKTNYFWNS